MFKSVLFLSSARYTIAHPWQFLLSIVGISLGVAVVISITQSGASAKRAFEMSTQAVTGRTSHQIVASSFGFSESIYRSVRMALPGTAAAPVVEGYVQIPVLDGRMFTLLGVDPFAETPFREFLDQSRPGTNIDLSAFLTVPGGVIVSSGLADLLGLGVADSFTLTASGHSQGVVIVGIIAPNDVLLADFQTDLLISDVATAQEMLKRVGRLDRIDLIVTAESLSLLEKLLPTFESGLAIVSADQRLNVARDMTRAFNLNLVMLSLLALAVGMFLIYNTVSFSVVQRRFLIGNLRALGVTRGQIFRLILTEATVLGLLGSILGMAIGLVLSAVLIQLVSQTINDLYFVLNVRDVSISPRIFIKGIALGVGASILAAMVPAFEATKVPPRVAFLRSVVESKVRQLAPRIAILGGALVLASVILVLIPWGDLVSGFAALFCLVLGFALMTPYLTKICLGCILPGARRLNRALGPLSVQGVMANLSRTSVAIAALMVALSAGAGVGVMVDSFRQSVAQWLSVTLKADVYVSLSGHGNTVIDPNIAAAIEAMPQVRSISKGTRVSVETGAGPVDVMVIDMAQESYQGFQFLEGDSERAWRAFEKSEGVLISEPFAWHRKMTVGERLRLLTDRQSQDFTVHGVIRDYGSEKGVVIMSHNTYQKYWHARGFSNLSLYLAPQVDAGSVINAIRLSAREQQALRVRSNREIRELSMSVFERTFTITIVLRILAISVAFVGVFSALLILQLERVREVAVLRALGMTRMQVLGVVSAQTGLMGLLTGLLAIPLGFALALMLIGVINRRSFGWSIDFYADPVIVAQTVGLALIAALVAGIYPAYKMMTTPPALALHED